MSLRVPALVSCAQSGKNGSALIVMTSFSTSHTEPVAAVIPVYNGAMSVVCSRTAGGEVCIERHKRRSCVA